MSGPDTLFEDYKLAIETQMHFNDMLWKIRSLAITAMLAFGAYGMTLFSGGSADKSPQQLAVPLDALVVSGGLLLLLASFFADYYYYYKLLLGAVRCSTRIESQRQTEQGTIPYGLTASINKAISPGMAGKMVKALYGLPFLGGLWYVCLRFSSALEPSTVWSIWVPVAGTLFLILYWRCTTEFPME